eukprot:Seg6607.2 transcript_id=Seg6607.2/GoldUCD/mRNA.D3Y31 product="PHD finger protein ALFIN-LIKE 8" protein_id=Seg6607.2/GoldUCD/D3Y31
MPLPNFIRKCWEENRGLGRQFILGLKKGLEKDKDASRNMKSCYRSLKQLSGNVNEVAGDNEFQDDNSISHRVEEQWEKGEKPQSVKARQKSFQKPPSRKLNFCATKMEKKAFMEKGGKRNKRLSKVKSRDNPVFNTNPSLKTKNRDERKLRSNKGKRRITRSTKAAESSVAKDNDSNDGTDYDDIVEEHSLPTEEPQTKNPKRSLKSGKLGEKSKTNWGSDIFESDSESEYKDQNVLEDLNSKESRAYQAFKRDVLDQVRESETSIMKIRAKLRESWSKLPRKDKERYSLHGSNTKCEKCGEEEVEGSQEMISWICCSQCTLWYHTDCVRVDTHYANDIPNFICPTCVKSSKNGIFNFAYRLRNYDLYDIKDFDLLKEWEKIDDSLKEQIKQHTFPAINSVDTAVGPLEILSQRGLRNKYNNCWSNAAFQVLAGSVVSTLLPHPRNCPSEICRDMQSVVKRLQASSYGPLPFTSDMKSIVKNFTKRDQTIIHKQEDACELIEYILGD